MRGNSRKIIRAAGTAAFFLLCLWLSLYRLGFPYAPATSWESREKGKQIVLDFGEEKGIAGFAYYLGNYEDRVFLLETGDGSPLSWRQKGWVELSQVYQWGYVPLKTRGRAVRLTTEKIYTELRELIFFDQSGVILTPVNESDYPELFDEAQMFPGYPSFQAGTVFDEPVFARTAYEYLHGIRSFEDTHPPLGKLLISVGIALFGMNPFGWRVMGALAGTALLMALWAFADRLYRNYWISLFVTVLFAADFLRFTHSRLAQVDAFLVLFIMGMYYGMLRYEEALYAGTAGQGDKSLIGWLALSGICMGCAVSCKWSGCYGAAGLAVLWSTATFHAWKRKRIRGKGVLRICLWCCLFFLFIPAAIYILSYIPYVAIDPQMGFWERFLKNQVNMFLYHTSYGMGHPAASAWYQWPLIAKPFCYYQVNLGDLQETVILLGNPVLWWGGIAAFFYSLWHVLEGKDRRGFFLLVMFLAPLVPWILVPRSSFLYHYFPCLPALTLMTGLWAEGRGRKGAAVLGGCALAAVLLFVLYYPVISGYPVPEGYLSRLTDWLPWWSQSI